MSTETTGRTFSRNIIEAAHTLERLIDDPQYAGRTWTWTTIGEVLGLSRNGAQQVIYYLRANVDTHYWTVGIAATDFEIMPTRSVRDAYDGQINQMKHLTTRNKSMQHAWLVLMAVDPDPRMARIARHQEYFWRRQTEDSQANLERLMDEMVPGVSP